ncbi:MAG: hypothetical protein IJX18_01845 [Clostridia bacterium]|nr:hypothetical protein [Clostridia bacterium]
MRIGFVSSGGLQAFLRSGEAKTADLTLGCFEEKRISYHRELKGETRLFEDVAILSEKTDGVVICGAETESYGLVRNSVLVADKGKLLGVADMTHAVDGEMNSGAALRQFDTSIGKVGVIVAEDLYFSETAKSLTDCGSDVLVCSFARAFTYLESVLLRATAFFYGVPVFFCGKGGSMIADSRAREAFVSPLSPVYASFEPQKQYHLIQTRRRGYYCGD